MPLSSKAEKYPAPPETLFPGEAERGAYFPDDIMDPLVSAADGRHMPVSAQPHNIGGPEISPQTSKELITRALTDFCPALGEKAKAFFAAGFDSAVEKNAMEGEDERLRQDASRWRIKTVGRGETNVQSAIPADSPANPNPRAVIKYEYDGTLNSTIYLGHELGHGIADDLIRGKDNQKFGDNPLHIDEFQAYVAQHIVYDALRNNADPAIAKTAGMHFNATMAQNINKLANKEGNMHLRAASFVLARGVQQHLATLPKAERGKTLDTILGKNGPTDIIDVLHSIGIKDKKAVEAMATKVMDGAAGIAAPRQKPLPASTAPKTGVL